MKLPHTPKSSASSVPLCFKGFRCNSLRCVSKVLVFSVTSCSVVNVSLYSLPKNRILPFNDL
jgi:hypothetical protein